MVRALSGEKQIPLIAIDGPQLYSKWLGESEKALREVFKEGEAGGASHALAFNFSIMFKIAKLQNKSTERRTTSKHGCYQTTLQDQLCFIRNMGVISNRITLNHFKLSELLLRAK